MADNLNKVKERILKLREMVSEKGASENEALIALEKADKLMSEHGITESDLKTASATKDMREGEFRYRFKAKHPMSKTCGGMIAKFCGVYSWYSPTNQASKAFGFKGDVEMYEFLAKLIHDSMDRGWKEFLANNPPRAGASRHTEYWSYMIGFGNRISGKLAELIEARKPKATSSGTDLVDMKHAVVMDGLKQMLPGLVTSKPRTGKIRADMSAYDQGKAAGDKVNLNRPIAKQEASKMKAIG